MDSSCKEGDQYYLYALHGAFRLALAFAAVGLVSALFVAMHNDRGQEDAGKKMDEN